MRLGIIGGQLQGVEALYLATKLGWKTTLIDLSCTCAAKNLADTFLQGDAAQPAFLKKCLSDCDFILPTLENAAVMDIVRKTADTLGIPCTHDPKAYAITESKLRTDCLLQEHAFPVPAYYPSGRYPYIIKPSNGSGSRDVILAHNENALRRALKQQRRAVVIQEYIPGPSYSIEVVGMPGAYFPLLVTEVCTAADFDCNRINAPARLAPELHRKVQTLGKDLADLLRITGIFDVEAILAPDGTFRILELDARIPSQTPISVYHATGCNMLELLYDISRGRKPTVSLHTQKYVIYMHLHWSREQGLTFPGEHSLCSGGPLRLQSNFMGADEALTTYCPDCNQWTAAAILTGDTEAAVEERRISFLRTLREKGYGHDAIA